MSPDDFLLLATTVALLVFVAALASSGGKTKKTPEAPKEITRWRRYRVSPAGIVHPPAAPVAVVEEEPKGLKLHALPIALPHRLRASRPDGTGRIDVARKWGLGHRPFRVAVDGKPRCVVGVPKRDRSKVTIERLDGGAALSLRGAPLEREYEVLEGGRLIAIVSWQRTPEDGEEPKPHYVVEVEKATEELPVLALVLAVEKALG